MIVFILLAIGLIAGFFIWWFSPGKYRKDKYTRHKQPLEPKIQESKEQYARRPEVPKSPNFIKSNSWIGKKHGYVFKNGKHGQGYYKDRKVKFDTDQVVTYSPHESPHETGKRIR